MNENNVENNISIDSLIVENMKLRRLLSLQQRSFAYRHSLMNSNTNSFSENFKQNKKSLNNSTSGELEDEDDDDQRSQQNTSIMNDIVKIACVFCPKVFSSPSNYTRHLTLRHLTATANNDLWVSPFKTLELLYSTLNNSAKISLVRTDSNNSKTDSTFKEDDSMKNSKILEELSILHKRLIETEAKLHEEKKSRENFEKILLNKFENDYFLRKKFTNKLEEENDDFIDKKTGDDEVECTTERMKNNEDSENYENKQIKNHKKKSKNPSNNDKTDKDEKESKRIEMEMKIEELLKNDKLTTKKFNVDLQNKVKEESELEDEKKEEEKNSKEYEEKNESESNKNKSIREDVEISLSERLSQYINDRIQQSFTKIDIKDDSFDKAMQQIQKDRDLLIHQARYDYDFEDIESSLKNMIDSRVKEKLENSNEYGKDGVRQVSFNGAHDASKNLPFDEKFYEIQNKVNTNNFTDSKENHTNSHKSILSSSNRKKTENPKKKITFSDQVVEFPFYKDSPSQSDSEDDDGLTEEKPIDDLDSSTKETNRKNQMFIIREMNDKTRSNSIFDHEEYHNQINGEKIYINDSTSSSSDEDDLNEIVPKTIPGKVSRPNSLVELSNKKNPEMDTIAELVEQKIIQRQNNLENNLFLKNDSSKMEETELKQQSNIHSSGLNGLSFGNNESAENYDIYDF